jgi:HEAT repeat protein
MKHTLLSSTFLATLAFAPSAFTQESGTAPRDLLERAHYAENHEHDLAAAKSGYQAAIDAATARGESDIAAEAGRALERVRVRLGEIAAPVQEELPADLVELFVEAQAVAAGSERVSALARDMALYGDAATAVLAEWIRLPRGSVSALITTAQRMVVANPYFAAAALGHIGTEQARAALLGALDLNDPLLRREIITQARDDHGALFAKAIDDPIDALRTLAAQRLLGVEDPSLAPAFETLVRRGFDGAEFRLVMSDPVRALALLGDGAISPDQQERLEQALRNRPWRDLSPTAVERFFAAASAKVDSRQRRAAEGALRQMTQPDAIELAVDPAAVHAALERALAAASPDLQLRHGWVLGPERALTLLESYLASSNDLLTEEQDDQVEGLARYCVESSSGGSAVATRLFRPILARSEIARIEATRPGSAYPNECAASSMFAWAVNFSVQSAANDALFLELHESIPQPARMAFRQQIVNWISNRLPRDPALITPGTLDPRFVEVAVSLLQNDKDTQAAYSVVFIARAIGTASALEQLITRTNFPYGAPGQFLKSLAQGIDAKESPTIVKALLAALAPIAGEPSPNARAQQLIQFGFDLQGVSQREFMLAVWALPLADELRADTYASFADWQQGDEVLPTLLELYASVPATGSSARAVAIKRFGTNLYEPAIDLLGEALRDRELSVREAAQAAFQRFREHREALEEYEAWRQASDDARETVAELVKLLASDNKDVVRGAVEALGAVKARTALPQLVALLERDDAELKAAVTKAIAAIGG